MTDNSGYTPTNSEGTENLSEILRIRREKLNALRQAGRDPYKVTKYDVTHNSAQIRENFDSLDGTDTSVAGRIITRRIMGKASFATIQDGAGRIQIYIRRDDLGNEEYENFKKQIDIGDIIGVTGSIFKTKTGEISIHAKTLTLLTKSLLPLPEKFHGLTDTELRYRQRYVDLIVNPEVKETFIKRSAIIREIRSFLDARGFLEVDTPVLHTISIGANARPFVTHLNALDLDMYLRIETELYLKRLIVGGLERVYEIGRIFRNEGMDTRHNPEFTTVELYQAYTDYRGMMEIVEDLYSHLAKTICGSLKITYQGKEIDMTTPWTKMTMREAVKKYAGVSYDDWADDEAARKCAKEHNVECEENATRGEVLEAFFETYVEDNLIQPTFIYEYPVDISPLAKRCPDNPEFTERFEFFINASEMGNAFSELNDPIDQRTRFERQVAEKHAQGYTNAQVDEDFLCALEYGLPPTGGLGFGVDRLVMLLTDNASIRDVLLFPTMKPLQ
ncbi:MAG: lysine--tRNA ligase [Eubacteriales bacterium]|jgi:lysyl-tRNA synthetase class 2|nr:lysine--tRNA ligase [Clostridiales bacterium]